ncbi:MAG: hypothetical protein R3C53_17040 [Pirellulaceae bacterium]
MTIRVEVARIDNVFQANRIINVSSHKPCSHEISAVSFIAPRPSLHTPWETVIRECADSSVSAIARSNWKALQWFFFGVTDTWRLKTRVSDYKKFWKVTPQLNASRPTRLSPEVELTSGAKHRFAAMAAIRSTDVPVFAEWIRATQCGMFILTDATLDLTAAITSTFAQQSGAASGTAIDWNRAVSLICSSKFIIGRCSGAFDDPDASVDFFFDPRFVQPFEELD